MSHPYAASNDTVSLPALYARNEKEKKKHLSRSGLGTEKRIISTSCLLDHRRLRTKLHQGYKRVAAKISDKRGEQYAHVMGFIRTRLRFSLFRSVLIAVRGVRGNQ